jgi:hypothetical protein
MTGFKRNLAGNMRNSIQPPNWGIVPSQPHCKFQVLTIKIGNEARILMGIKLTKITYGAAGE